MASSIKIFQFFQLCHQASGLFPFQSNQKYLSTNSTRAIVLISCIAFIFTMAAFMVLEAKTMFEYGFTFFVLISILNGVVIYLILIWKQHSTPEFIVSCERFIEKSKYKYGLQTI